MCIVGGAIFFTAFQYVGLWVLDNLDLDRSNNETSEVNLKASYDMEHKNVAYDASAKAGTPEVSAI
eukprot:819970-Prorocentrum_minimum.AAC.1